MFKKFHRRLESSPTSRVSTQMWNTHAVTWQRVVVGGGVEYLWPVSAYRVCQTPLIGNTSTHTHSHTQMKKDPCPGSSSNKETPASNVCPEMVQTHPHACTHTHRQKKTPAQESSSNIKTPAPNVCPEMVQTHPHTRTHTQRRKKTPAQESSSNIKTPLRDVWSRNSWLVTRSSLMTSLFAVVWYVVT